MSFVIFLFLFHNNPLALNVLVGCSKDKSVRTGLHNSVFYLVVIFYNDLWQREVSLMIGKYVFVDMRANISNIVRDYPDLIKRQLGSSP